MKHQTRTLAEIVATASTAEELLKSPCPLRRDRLGRQIFADGSWLDHNALGEPIYGSYDPAEWVQLEGEAWMLGRKHRLARKRIHSAFKGATRRYPARVCRSYLEGFFSVTEWPKKTSE